MTQRRSTQVRETPRKRMVQARIKARALENNTTIRNGNIIIIYRDLQQSIDPDFPRAVSFGYPNLWSRHDLRF
jgi:hypothetical protein